MTSFITQLFEERRDKATILVIGASYSHTELDRWFRLDPDYIGIGKNYTDSWIDFSDSNPFDADWNNPEYWQNVLNLFIIHKKQFQTIYIDRGVIQHLPKDFLLSVRVIQASSILLKKGGQLIFPWNHDSNDIYNFEQNLEKMSIVLTCENYRMLDIYDDIVLQYWIKNKQHPLEKKKK